MPFEPLGTDEPTQGSNYPRPPKSFENQLVGGCSTIFGGSLAVFLLTWWPFLVFPANTTTDLTKCLLFAAIPVLIVGVVLVRFFALAGSIAFSGGLFVGAVFLFMNLNLETLGIKDPNLKVPDYPEQFRWIIPLAWMLAGLAAMLFAYRDPEKKPEG